MKETEREEALKAIANHYGIPALLALVDEIVGNISKGVMSVPLDKDPEKAALTLYSERMKAEGATAVQRALITKVKAIKTGEK